MALAQDRAEPVDEKIVLAEHLYQGMLDQLPGRSQLPRTRVLFDVRDTEALCASVIAKSGFSLSRVEHEDALAHLLGEACRLAERYEPGRGSFSNLATRGLRTKLVDWQRQRLGRTKWQFKDRVHIRERPVIVSLDDDVVGAELAGSLGRRAWATVNIGWPLSSGASMKEFSAQLGESQKWVEAQLERLQHELVRLSAVATPVDVPETAPGPHQQRI